MQYQQSPEMYITVNMQLKSIFRRECVLQAPVVECIDFQFRHDDLRCIQQTLLPVIAMSF